MSNIIVVTCVGKMKRPQTCKCKKGTDWLKRWVEAQHNIFKL